MTTVASIGMRCSHMRSETVLLCKAWHTKSGGGCTNDVVGTVRTMQSYKGYGLELRCLG